MPRTKLTPEQQLEQLNRRASETAVGIAVARCKAVLRNFPDLAGPMWEKAKSLRPEEELLRGATESAEHAGDGRLRSLQAAAKSSAKESRQMKSNTDTQASVAHGHDIAECFQHK
eukprot:6481349-Amphidinium_carterae.2